jgi:hypothetical protein
MPCRTRTLALASFGGISDMHSGIAADNFVPDFAESPQWHLLPQRARPVSSPMTLPGGILLSGEM